MEKIKILFVLISLACITESQATNPNGNNDGPDSLIIFFIGNKSGENFEIYFKGKLLLKFKGSGSYKYSIAIPKLSVWDKRRQIIEIDIYRKGKFGIKYRHVAATYQYDPDKKFLILWRAHHLKNYFPFIDSWSNEEPLQLPALH
jgi:hypothetical protein